MQLHLCECNPVYLPTEDKGCCPGFKLQATATESTLKNGLKEKGGRTSIHEMGNTDGLTPRILRPPPRMGAASLPHCPATHFASWRLWRRQQASRLPLRRKPGFKERLTSWAAMPVVDMACGGQCSASSGFQKESMVVSDHLDSLERGERGKRQNCPRVRGEGWRAHFSRPGQRGPL